MNQPAGHITQFRLYPVRALWAVGPGWAALGGGLAAGGFALSPETLLKFLVVWLLADPLLGAIWGLGVGGNAQSTSDGIWTRLLNPQFPDHAPPLKSLPYTQPNSPGRRLFNWLGRLRAWWQESFWPEAGRGFASLVAASGLALLVAIILANNSLILVGLSVALSWLAVLSRGKNSPDATRRDVATLWCALGEFGVPWLIGAFVLGTPTWAIIALGGCYTIAYFGLIRRAASHNFRLVGAGQLAAVLLLAGLRHPLAAGAMAILWMPQWGLHTWTAYVTEQVGDHPAVFASLLARMQPFVVLSLLVAAWAIAL